MTLVTSLRASSFLSWPNRSLPSGKGLQFKLVGDDREGLEAPETVFLLVDVLRHLEAHEMAEPPTR